MCDATEKNTTQSIVGGKKAHVSLSDGLKKEREKLFGKIKPTKLKRRANEIINETPTAKYFSDSAEKFRKTYRHGRKTKDDIQMMLIFLSLKFEVEIDDVLSSSRKLPLPMVRKYFAFFSYYYFMKTHEQIALIINRERSTITTSIQDAIDDLEFYARSRDIASHIDKFLHDICSRRKHEI